MGKVQFCGVLLYALGLGACGAGTKGNLASLAASREQSGPVEIATADGVLRLTVLSADTVRVLLMRSAQSRVPASFAVSATVSQSSALYTLEEHPGLVILRTSQLGVRITKQPLRIALLDAQGQLLSEQAAPVAWQNPGLVSTWKLAPREQVYGLGDKVKGFDRRGQAFEFWNTDAYGFQSDADPLYKSIPFALFLRDGRAHGLFLDTPARAQVDVGKSNHDVFSYAAESGDSLDFYLFAGPDPKRVISAYTALTGRMPLPPRWALGYHQSRYSYLTEQEARSVAERLRADAIPSDALWLDIDYQLGNAPFTVDSNAFPHFAGMVSDLTKLGMRTVVITDPHLKSYQGQAAPSGYAPYDSGAAGDHFLRAADGGFVEDKVWPGLSVFPEFTLTRTRR